MCVGENEKIGWPILLAAMIFKSAWYSIFKRLMQLGYEREVSYHPNRIKQSCKALFAKSKPLTDKG